MKIVFFKNELNFTPRLSYTWENAEQVILNSKLQNLKKLSILLLLVPLIAFLFVNLKDLSNNLLLLFTILLLCLPIH